MKNRLAVYEKLVKPLFIIVGKEYSL